MSLCLATAAAGRTGMMSLRLTSKQQRRQGCVFFQSPGNPKVQESDYEDDLPLLADDEDDLEGNEKEKNQAEPPAYDDPRHPWAKGTVAQWLMRRRSAAMAACRKIEEEEAMEETLPPYECTVSRVATLRVKREMELPYVKAKKRNWRKLSVRLWGTCIQAYNGSKPVWSYSTQDAEVGLATDYTKHRHVVRVRIKQGPQFLLRPRSAEDAVLWIDAFQASTNLCPDLDSRVMPQFAFSMFGRRRRRQQQQRQQRQQNDVDDMNPIF
ncbi:hypothetical protein BCR43DRAFT_483805 [Syncephalastrum racemosum]|uniref:PH domain-containing protein n=1 Tax=Syncephalastrum racemosum TaxID=13706 RepID=A0A1X2HW06_SYNRA|nr:hypothetical protein BCR43DRAFT_483805 [Syncephalastrum racemosum]